MRWQWPRNWALPIWWRRVRKAPTIWPKRLAPTPHRCTGCCALASLGVFEEDASARFSLTPLANYLRKDVEGSQWAFAMLAGEEFSRAWGDLLYSVQTGKSAFTKAFGKPIFDYLGDHPEKARLFDAAMTSVHGRESQAMLDAYDLSDVGTFVDVGGGNGKTLMAVLNHYPKMKGVLFDLPHVAIAAQAGVRAGGLEGRLQTVGGASLTPYPPRVMPTCCVISFTIGTTSNR